MTAYTIANLPTQYRGRMYRSRLEARWAAFFDRLGWTHEYEPFDLGRWSPDFAITEPFDALVEVKPATELDVELAERVASAGDTKEFRLITRVAPMVNSGGAILIGWWASSRMPASLVWLAKKERPEFVADIFSISDDTWVTAGGHSKGNVWSYEEYAMRLWADASNAVQWEPAQ